jgi:glycosyltransferase involved in cell wall biosynthesis
MKTVVIEGWRYIPHSYAMVNQHQCLELLKRPDIRLFHRDVPYFFPNWRPMSNLWSAQEEARLRSIPPPPAGIHADAMLRIGFPHFLHNDAGATATFAWGTTEFGLVQPSAIGSRQTPQEALSKTEATIVACSNWAAKGFLNSGAPREKVVVVPCGVDTDVFKPADPAQRAVLRKQFGWEDKFVILNVSAMTGNKGILHLLKALAAVAPQFPQLTLVLKGADDLYRSLGNAQHAFGALTPQDAAKVQPRMHYIGATVPTSAIASFMQAADLYVSPYLAEGFNLPVLEAVACGLPVICTRGGSTDDFVSDDFALRVKSTLVPMSDGGLRLEPDHWDLVTLLAKGVTDTQFRSQAASSGPVWVKERFTWKHAVDKLLDVLLPRQNAESGAR